jgi:5S rRNA maturation endonuclease (ribonuclease M5)
MSPRSREEVAELILEWIDDLNSLEGNPLIVVEGKRDVTALGSLGVQPRSTSLNLGLSMQDLVGSILEGKGPFQASTRHDLVVVITDWDDRGYRLARSIKEACAQRGLACDLDFRRRISALTGRWVKDVESLPSLLKGLTGDISTDVGYHPDGIPPDG